MRWPAGLLLATVVALAPPTGFCMREGSNQFLGLQRNPLKRGSPGSAADGSEPWQPLGMAKLAQMLHSAGHVEASRVVRENPWAALGLVLALLSVLVLVLALSFYFCWIRRTDAAAASAAAQPSLPPTLAAGAGATAEDGGELPAEIKKLKREKTRILLEQAMQKAKLERLINDILQMEAELEERKRPPVDPEEISKQAQEAMRATEMMTERSLISVLAYMAPLAYQSGRIIDVMEKRRVALQARAAKVAFDEAQVFCKDLVGVFAIDEEVRNAMFNTLSHLELPSIATIVQSAFAPAKLNFLMVRVQLSIAIHMFYILVAAFVILMDRKLFCGRNDHETSSLIFWWFSTDLAVCTLCLLIRFWSLFRISRVVESIEMPPVAPEKPVEAFRLLLDYYMTVGADALAKYDEFMRSWVNALANWAVLFSTGWMFYAVWLIFNTPWANCATAGLIILRVRVCFFLIFLLPVLIGLASTFASSYLGSDSFKTSIIVLADYLDTVLMLGMPVLGIMVQIAVSRSPRDLTVLGLRRAEMKKYELAKQQSEAEKTLEEVEASKQELERQIQRLQQKREEEVGMTDEEFRAKHLAAKDAICKDAELLFTKLTGKAEELTRNAEGQIQKWEQEGAISGISGQDLRDAGFNMEQVQHYMDSARKEVGQRVSRIVGDETVQRALGQVQERAQRAGDAVRERMKDLPSVEEVREQSAAALGQAAQQGAAALGAMAQAAQAPPPATSSTAAPAAEVSPGQRPAAG